MLNDVMDVAKRAGAFLDDPSLSIYKLTYLMPFIDQCYEELDVDLERCGMQYVEGIVEFVNPAGTSDLSPLLADGQPLQYMKFPKWVDWKLPGQPDSMYTPSAMVSELQDFDAATGAWQWRFGDGGLQVTKAAVDVALRVYFDTMSTTIYDPAQGVIRGTAHILAAAVAREVYSARKGMEKQAARMDLKYKKIWNSFKSVVVMNNQGKQPTAKPMHPRQRVATPYVPAPTS